MRRLLSRLRFAFWCWLGRRIPAAAYWAERADSYRAGQLECIRKLAAERQLSERFAAENAEQQARIEELEAGLRQVRAELDEVNAAAEGRDDV